MPNYNKIFDSYCKNANEGVVYIKKGDESFNYQYGMDLDKKFALGGVTKLYTIACVLNLIAKGRLILDSKLSNFISEEGLCVFKGIDYTKDITLRDLLFQKSGIPDYYNTYVGPRLSKGDISYSFSDKVNWVKSLKANVKPNTKTEYSNANADFLAYIVTKASGLTLEEAYDEFIFKKLGLTNTYLPKDENVTIPVIFVNGVAAKRPKMIMSCRGSGGLVTTSRELMKFLKSFASFELFDKSLFEKLLDFNSINSPYGNIYYGGGIMKLKSKYNLLGHFGFSGAFAYFDIDRDYYVCGCLSTPGSSINLSKMVVDFFEKG